MRSQVEVGVLLAERDSMDLLRFITCGSVDDGKSTLIGRLLSDSSVLYDDHRASLEADSKRHGTQGGSLDFALLLDGLAAEREQGITIDVAYRHFSTARRRFIIADTPGHEEYTRNMATGASTADCAVILVDARKGVLSQTLRHSYIVATLGIRKVVLAVNKMDLVDYSAQRFREIERDYRDTASRIGLTEIATIPVSALHGDNVVERSRHTDWSGVRRWSNTCQLQRWTSTGCSRRHCGSRCSGWHDQTRTSADSRERSPAD